MGPLHDVRYALSAFDACEEVRDVIDAIDIVLGERHRVVYRRLVRYLCCYRSVRLNLNEEEVDALRGHVVRALAEAIFAEATLAEALASGEKNVSTVHNPRSLKNLIDRLNALSNTLPPPYADTFCEAVYISAELGSFLNLDRSITYSKVFVIRKIYDYITDHNLHDRHDTRVVSADPSLKALFRISEDEVVTYFQVGPYLEHHFTKVYQKIDARVGAGAVRGA